VRPRAAAVDRKSGKPVLKSRLLALAACVLSTGVVLAQQDGRPWPPPVIPVSADSTPKSPEASMRTFSLPPGYRVELVAAEPLIQDPIVTEFDFDGRLWVIEMPGYMPELNPSNERERQPDGRVVVLEDTDGDGRMDTRRVFLDGLVLPRAMKVLADGILVAEPPDLWFVPFDQKGNAGQKVRVTDTYGRRDAGIEHNENSLWWGFDNWLHTSEGTTQVRRKPDGTFEVRRTLSRGQWGATHDDQARIYRNTNESVLHVDLVPTPYYARNPNVLRTRGAYETLIGLDREVNRVWPAHTTPGVNRGYVFNVLGPNGALANFTSVSAPVIFRGDRLPADVYGNAFVVEPAANLVSRIILSDDGPDVKARKAYEGAEFLASTDERFRPVYLNPGPDGTLYVLDMYRGIIQHRDYVTEYLRDQILSRNLVQPTGFGRVYRIVHESLERGPAPRMSAATSSVLVGYLSHPNGWWRDMAHQLLVQRGDRAVVPALVALAEREDDPRARLHALWILDGLDQIDVTVVRRALSARDRAIRVAAVRIAERWMADASHPIVADVRARIQDDDLAVRRQVAASIGELPETERVPAAASLLERDGEDPIVVDAALSSLRGVEVAVLQRLMSSRDATPAREAAMTMLAATVVRSADDVAIQQLFGWTGDTSRPEWQRSAVLGGIEAAWLNARLPGTPAPRAAAVAPTPAPCPTCPGGRAGPGGASAFMQPQEGRGGRGGGPAPIRVSREPVSLSALSAAGGPLGERAARILGRIEWPGKPGATPVTPLTAAEERRFDEGRTVFTNACVACHQADGRGRDRVAPTLVGSDLVLAPAGVPARILLNGKEGPVGLMPPLGQALTDDQAAAVLTYIRRQWGNVGSPVEPATVREVRAETAGRARPWSHDEIVAMAATATR
jgi:mono/diheme cytochrome c family protein/glucose/arabinose dehydrogenase